MMAHYVGKIFFNFQTVSFDEIHIWISVLSGMVPVTIRPPHPQNIATTLPTVKMIVEVSKSVAILTYSPIIKMMKSKVSLIYSIHYEEDYHM